MATKVFMEALSPTMEEGRISSWLKQEGDSVVAGDALAEVETDKAVMELQARGHGILRKIIVPEGGTTDVGNIVAVIAGADEDIGQIVGEEGGEGGEGGERGQATPGTPPAPTPPSPPPGKGGAGRLRASPLARRLATEKGVDLASVAGSGPGGRIIKRDVEATTPTAPSPPSPPWGGAERGGYEDVVPSQLRKTIAKRLVQSLGPVPHFFLTTEIDMEAAAVAREGLNALGDTKISFNDIVTKVVAMALLQHRDCNAWWQGDHVRYFSEVHISMAVAIDDGLITPVIRDAHLKSLRAIAAETKELAERARTRKLIPEEYTGGTFSISNLGMFGIDEFTAVINPPEAGILAVGAMTPRPVAHDGAMTVRRRMRVTMSCDHRVIDGATGARFLQTVKRMLENPLAMVW